MFKHIVVGMDGSERAQHALDVATELAKAGEGRITIAHVDEETIGKGGGPIHADEPERIAGLKEKASRLSESGTEADVRVESMLMGTAGARIAAVATDVGADLIAVGTHGHGAMAGALLGSTAHKLLGVAHVPVLVVPDPAREPVNAGEEGSAAAAG
jgi:nucleotide-binding universal stress UspA family protein